MFFSVYTLGCKLNQLETEAIIDSFCKAGFILVPWDKAKSSLPEHGSGDPSILILNTCTVTSMAEQKARRIIRKALKDFPAAPLIITGCYAQMDKDGISALCMEQDRIFVIPGEEKDRIMDLPRYLAESGVVAGQGCNKGVSSYDFSSVLPGLIASWLASLGDADKEADGAFLRGTSVLPDLGGRYRRGTSVLPDLGGRYRRGTSVLTDLGGRFRFLPENFASHSRGFLKIQDGCDRSCAYCRVSLARGKSCSFPAENALKALKALEQRGFGEVVLTGVNISQYRDLNMGLPELLDFLLGGTERIRLRLSSIEPDFLVSGNSADNFFRILANPRIMPHLHLSIQSGSAEILSKMERSYIPGDVERAVCLIRSVRLDPFIACDIITGFPGETEEEFEKTRELCERKDFAWIHAFPFSPRPGTAAFGFPGKVSQRDAVKRVELLTSLARKGRREYICRWEGKEVEAVVERGGGAPACHVHGVSENYLKLLIDCGADPLPAPGTIIRCRVLSASKEKGIDAFAGKIP